MDSVTVKVPCSTSNLGSGFDTLGLALDLYSRVTVARAKQKGIVLRTEGRSAVEGARELCAEAAGAFFRYANASDFGAEVSVSGDVPVARGLGFSSTVRAGIIAGLNALADTRFTCD